MLRFASLGVMSDLRRRNGRDSVFPSCSQGSRLRVYHLGFAGGIDVAPRVQLSKQASSEQVSRRSIENA